MRTLVAFYSFEGNTKHLSGKIAEAVKGDILEIRALKEPNSKGFMKFFWGGRQAIMNKRPKIDDPDKDPADYDLIFIGAPVWAGRPAPPIMSFMDKVDLKDKKVAIFCCHEGGPGKIFQRMKEPLEGSDIVGEKDFFAPLKKDKETITKDAEKWARELVSSLN